MVWNRALTTGVSVALNGREARTILDGSASPEFKGATITRIVGNVTIRATDSGALQPLRWSLGIILVDQVANLIGVTALPNPGSAAIAPWLHWTSGVLPGIALPTDNSALLYQHREDFDIRAQRKLDEGNRDLVVIIDNATGFAVLEMNFGVSVLLKLP